MATRKKASNEPPIQIVPFGDLPTILAVLLYGRSGTGKTTVASSFPKPLLLLDVREKGTDSVANVKGGHVGSITEWDEFESMYWYLKKGGHPYKTVVIDQVSQLQDLAIRKALETNKKEATDPVAKRDFGVASGLMKTWLLDYRDLIDEDINVVFIAHDRSIGGEEDAQGDQIEPSIGPRLMPSIASFLNGSVKIIGNTFIRERFEVKGNRKVRSIDYGIRVGPHAYYTTKMRSPVGIASPAVIVNPTYEKMRAALKGEYQDDAISEPAEEKGSTVRKKK